jgi:hypothetical protein
MSPAPVKPDKLLEGDIPEMAALVGRIRVGTNHVTDLSP